MAVLSMAAADLEIVLGDGGQGGALRARDRIRGPVHQLHHRGGGGVRGDQPAARVGDPSPLIARGVFQERLEGEERGGVHDVELVGFMVQRHLALQAGEAVGALGLLRPGDHPLPLVVLGARVDHLRRGSCRLMAYL
jgi:hypothetical protein